VVIDGGKILTNAHIVANHTFVQVKRKDDPAKYKANVLFKGHDCDLAILEVSDQNFQNGIKPLKIGSMPRIRDKVIALGFPVGGDKLSITEGVVSRIEMGHYHHCSHHLLEIQIDAAINPGNSGGPVINNGRIVGIAFQGLGYGDNVGYMIPPPVIRHFLSDVQDGVYDGFPTLGIFYQTLESPHHRSFLKMHPDQSGVLVTEVAFQSSAWDVLMEGDVILSVDGEDVANDGTISFMNEDRIAFPYCLVNKFPGDTVEIKVLREGQEKEVNVPLRTAKPFISQCEYDEMPSYYIFGGLIFMPLSLNYLNTWGGWWKSPVRLQYHYLNGGPTPDREQLVILQDVLADELNVGYHQMGTQVVEMVNGESIKNFKDFVDKIESSDDEFIEIYTESHHKIVLPREEALAANSRILELHKIPADRSEDLRKGHISKLQ
jgi:S1-C subfamily serine protease